MPEPDPPPPEPGPVSPSYEIVAHACAMAIQDAAVYMRSMQTLVVATTGAAQERMLNGANVQDAATVVALAQMAVTAAGLTFGEVGVAASSVLKSFPVRTPSGE